MNKIKLAVVDDHKLFRDGLTELINGFTDYTVILEADNGNDFIQQLKKTGLPDIVMLDINMKEMDGFQTAEWLKTNYPDIKILVLSMYENESGIIRMIRAGAKGYILKDIRKKELEYALASVVSKGFYYSEIVTGKLVHMINHMDDDPKAGGLNASAISLSTKEKEFLKLVCMESTYKEIAEKMCLSIHTIDGYRDALFEKLKVKSRVGLVMFAIKNKIVLID